jgi:hypothetical protein
MSDLADPTFHRDRQREFVEHVERLLSDERFAVDTAVGRRGISLFERTVKGDDRSEELRRLLMSVGVHDREIEAKLPKNEGLKATLYAKRFFFFRRPVGEVEVICESPQAALAKEERLEAMSAEAVKRALTRREGEARAPVTRIVVSTSGFEADAVVLAKQEGGSTLILVAPKPGGGWAVHAPRERKDLAELLDGESEGGKRRRIREAVERSRAELLHGGLGASRIGKMTELPLALVENELKLIAAEAGLAARRLGDELVVYRDGVSEAGGGVSMAFMNRVKSLFSRKGDHSKKIALLAERRAALSLQRDRSYDEMGVLEKKESELRKEFHSADGMLTKRRITSQLVQLRKDLERRQQLLGMLNQQINVVSTHLHNIELVQQGQSAKLPSSEDLAQDAAAAEEVLAQLQADSELAASISGTTASGMSDEEQALYDELERQSAAAPMASAEKPASSRVAATSARATEPPPLPGRQRSDPEPG